MRYQIIDNFLTPEECTKLIEIAITRLEPSTGWDVATGTSKRTDYRTSDQMFFLVGGGTPDEGPLIRSIEDRIAKLTGLPVENGEGFQVLRYGVGGHYKVHCDWFDPRYPGNEPVLKTGGQRVATVLTYLNTVDKGGETYFPKVPNATKEDALRIKPEQGKSIFWWNVDENGDPDTTTLHSGEDVLEGEKWVLTKWLRKDRFGY